MTQIDEALEFAARIADTLATGVFVEIGADKMPLGIMCKNPTQAQRATAEAIAACIRSYRGKP